MAPVLLHYVSGSPFAWRVWLALEHKGVAYEARRLRFDRGETRAPALLALNPRGLVPVIEHDGRALRESAVILEYLEDRFPAAPPLMPADARARAGVRLIAREADEHLYPHLRRLMAQTLFRPADDGDRAEIAAAREGLAAELARLEGGMTGDDTFLDGGPVVTLADLTVYPHLRLLRRLGERMPQHAVDALIGPRLAAWMGRVEALPYFDRTLPPHWRE